MDFLEKLPAIDPFAVDEERWLVREADALRVAWLFGDPSSEWIRDMVKGTQRWVGFAHPRVSRILRVEPAEPRVMFVIEDDRGPTLVDAAAALPAEERERWAVSQLIAICDGLAAMRAHDPAFVHRAIAPHRIFVDPSGHARLRAPVATLGVRPEPANRVGSGRIVGTPEYMAPEQAQGRPTTPATDVFALATNLTQVLTGASPFANENMMQVLMTILQGPAPTVPGASAGLASVLARAFAKEPAQRFADPAALGAALRAVTPDADEVDAVISDRIAAWWPAAAQARGAHDLFGPPCHKQWSQLAPTSSPSIRACGDCNQQVVQVESIAACLPLVGQCVSLRRS